MLTAQAYLEVVKRRGERNQELERVYHNLRNPDLFLMAYGRLYANPGVLTPGTEPSDSIDGMSKAKIEKIIQSLADGSFRWQPARRIHIPKANGKQRPLSLPGWTDKLVQETMRLILEAYYEPRFSPYSHGFRPNRGCHTALQEIQGKWKGTVWFIEMDIKGCFENIDHEILLGLIGRQIKDSRFLKLLREMLKVGYMEGWQYQTTYSGTPQGGVVSPLLANIYLNELDRFVEKELLSKYNKGKNRKMNPVYRQARSNAERARKQGETELAEMWAKKQRTIRSGLPDPEYKRLRYVRYADDALLGYVGTRQEAEEIKEEIGKFLQRIKLTLSVEKTLITHAVNEPARFLGYDIQATLADTKRKNNQRSINGQIMLRVPREVKQKWEQKYQQKGKPVHDCKLLANADYDIVQIYNQGLLGLTNYYTLAVNIASLSKVKWLMEISLVKTLAAKHKQTVSWVYQHYRATSPEGLKCLEVQIDRGEKKPLVARFGGKSIRYAKFAKIENRIPQLYTGRTQLIQRLLADHCELCGNTGKIEIHHVRSIKKLIQKYRNRGREMPWWVEKMATMYRKTLAVCVECHHQIHAGTYDGRKLI